ncbi:MAG: hypothetical protein ACYC26_07825 [Phycisphaerales bacterium]
MEGDLVPPPGQGAPQDFYWAARIAVAGMTAYRPRHGAGYAPFTRTAVPEEQEEDAAKGPGIRINNNDTDPDGEDDLIEVEIKRSSSNVELALHRGSGVIKVFRSADKQNEISFTSDKTAALSFDGGNTLTVFVEWADANHGTVDLHLEPPGNNNVMDTVRFHTFHSVVVVLGGWGQTPKDPTIANEQTWQIAIDLYREGYDAWMWDESAVANTFYPGSGVPYDEVVTAINRRQVADVAVYGYSRGGNATWYLVNRLNTENGTAVAFSGYCDAVAGGNGPGSSPETRRPTGSRFQKNYYQTYPSGWLGLHGDATIGLLAGDNQQDLTNRTAPPLVDHFNIDDLPRTVGDMKADIKAKCPNP